MLWSPNIFNGDINSNQGYATYWPGEECEQINSARPRRSLTLFSPSRRRHRRPLLLLARLPQVAKSTSRLLPLPRLLHALCQSPQSLLGVGQHSPPPPLSASRHFRDVRTLLLPPPPVLALLFASRRHRHCWPSAEPHTASLRAERDDPSRRPRRRRIVHEG